MLIGWDRGHFFLITRALFGNQEGMTTWCWLAEHSCIKLVSRFKRSLKRNFRNSSRLSLIHYHGYFILTWKRINMHQSAVFWWKSKRIFPTEKVLIRSLKSDSVSTAGVARSIELHNFMAAKQEVNFVLHWVALWVLQLTLSALKRCKLCWYVTFSQWKGQFGFKKLLELVWTLVYDSHRSTK